jgi:hypothetical protein
MWRCPRCRSRIRIYNANATVLVYEDGVEQESGFEWDSSAQAQCAACNWNGTAGEAFHEAVA